MWRVLKCYVPWMSLSEVRVELDRLTLITESASEFELQPPSRMTATLPGDSSSGEKWSESSPCSSSWKKM